MSSTPAVAHLTDLCPECFGSGRKKATCCDACEGSGHRAIRRLCLDDIVGRVADFYGVPARRLTVSHSSRSFKRPRQLIIALARNLTHYSLPEIARTLGSHHATIIHLQRQFEEQISRDEELASELESLAQSLTSSANEGRIKA